MSLPPPVEQEVQIDRVYSHPVSTELQRQKLFALESMHDLRSSPSRLYRTEVGADRAIEPEEAGPSAVGGVNYLRSGPRSNELFFVYDETTLTPTINAFLGAWRSARRADYWPIAFVNALHGTGAPCTGAIVATSSFIRRTWLNRLRIAGVGAAGGGSCVSNRSASNAIRSAGR